MSKTIVLIVSLFGLVFTMQAQEATETPDAPPHRVQAWQAVYTDAPDGAALVDPETGEEVAFYAAFLEYEDGLISVLPGSDIIYSGDAEDGFTGSFLIPDPDISVTSTLEIIDEDTRLETRSTDLFGTEQLSYVTYTRTEDEVEIWSESPRNFIETTLLGECMGRSSATLSFGWVAPDLLMPIFFAEDGTVLMDFRLFVGGENEDISTLPVGDDTSTTIVLRTLDIAEDSIAFHLEGTVDGRDDCQMIYESTFTPFDADYENIFIQAEEIGAEFVRD